MTSPLSTYARHIKAISDQLIADSEEIREAYSTHNVSAGSSREDLAIKFLRAHLPSKFHITSGFALASDGILSKQSDILIVDGMNNVAFNSSRREQQWPIESIYAVVEVKTTLDGKALADAIKKCIAFKSMRRSSSSESNMSERRRTGDSLFCIFAFEGPSLDTTIQSLRAKLSNVIVERRPDLIVVLNKAVIHCGSYFETVQYGQVGSEFRREVESSGRATLPGFKTIETTFSLMFWFAWLNSWLTHAGQRIADPIKYLQIETHPGRQAVVHI